MLSALRILGIFALFSLVYCEETEQEIELRPAAELQHVELAQGNFICRFHYKVQGGTYEKWNMRIESSDDKIDYMCSISRKFSYLFFEEFSVETVNAIPEFLDGIDEKEYIIDRKKGIIKHNPTHFKNKVTKLIVHAKSPHGEL